MHLCTYVSEEGGDGEDVVSETLSLLSHTLCTFVIEEGGGREGADSKVLSLLSYTCRYVSLADSLIDLSRGRKEGEIKLGVFYESRKRKSLQDSFAES